MALGALLQRSKVRLLVRLRERELPSPNVPSRESTPDLAVNVRKEANAGGSYFRQPPFTEKAIQKKRNIFPDFSRFKRPTN